MNWRDGLTQLLIVSLLFSSGCGTYEYRKRPDNSEVAVIRDIQNVFPEFASEVTGILDGFKIHEGPLDTSLGGGEVRNQIVRLYDQKDQLNAQLRDFVVARYQSYINAELDLDRTARDTGRASWNEVTEKIHSAALEIRKLKETIDDAIRNHADAEDKSRNTEGKKLQSKLHISKAGAAIKELVVKNAEPSSKDLAHQVVLAKSRLDDALKFDELFTAKEQVEIIKGNVSQLWNPRESGKGAIAAKALGMGQELQRSVDDLDKLVAEQRAQQMRAEQAAQELAAKLARGVDVLKTVGTTLLVSR